MPTVSAIVKAVQAHKANLLAGEQGAASEMTSLYTETYERLRAQGLELAKAIRDEVKRTGQAPEALVYQRDRLGVVTRAVAIELQKFARNAAPVVSNRQRALITLAQRDAQALAQLQLPGLHSSPGGVPLLAESGRLGHFPTFRTVPTGQLESLVGATGDGSPLVGILDEIIATDGARRFRETLFQGIVSGKTDIEMSRDLARSMGAPYARSLTILRTEGMRAYRSSQQQFCVGNRDIISGTVWFASLSSDTCAACLSMHGTEHPDDYVMESHPNCRCVLVPKTRPWRELGLSGKETPLDIEAGGSWFDRQSEATKREILGPSKYEALKSGELTLADFRHRSHSDDWGGSYSVASLAQARANAEKRAG